MEQFVHDLSQLNPLWVYVAVAGIAYVENVFPPFPSDVIVVAAGSFVGLGTVDYWLALFIATTGSTLGFMTMYAIGHWFGQSILAAGKVKFLPRESVQKVEQWFQKYGYWLIVVNRFLAGTRAVVSFFAGLSRLNLTKTALLSFASALVWNGILLYAGKTLGENWEEVVFYLETYGKIVTSILVVILIVFLVRLLSRPSNAAGGG